MCRSLKVNKKIKTLVEFLFERCYVGNGHRQSVHLSLTGEPGDPVNLFDRLEPVPILFNPSPASLPLPR